MAVKLFVGGLSFSTSNERLREVFAATGTVESAAVVTDRDTRGHGSVTTVSLVRIASSAMRPSLATA
jgi:RNA recognition motif-containing protein